MRIKVKINILSLMELATYISKLKNFPSGKRFNIGNFDNYYLYQLVKIHSMKLIDPTMHHYESRK